MQDPLEPPEHSSGSIGACTVALVCQSSLNCGGRQADPAPGYDTRATANLAGSAGCFPLPCCSGSRASPAVSAVPALEHRGAFCAQSTGRAGAAQEIAGWGSHCDSEREIVGTDDGGAEPQVIDQPPEPRRLNHGLAAPVVRHQSVADMCVQRGAGTGAMMVVIGALVMIPRLDERKEPVPVKQTEVGIGIGRGMPAQ